MAQRIELHLDSSMARRLQAFARKWSGDPSLGMSQGCHVLLEAIDSGKFIPKPSDNKKQKSEEEPEE